jgi:hypothetical protein
VIAGARADIRDRFARPELQGFDEQRRFLLRLAFGTLQPVGGEMPHDVGDLEAHVELSDAIRIVKWAALVTIGRGRCWWELRIDNSDRCQEKPDP